MADSNKRATGGATGKGFKPGQSGNPGGRKKTLVAAIREQVGEDGHRLVTWFALVAMGTDAEIRDKFGARFAPKWSDRVACARELADRGFGRPVQALEHSGPDGAPLKANVAMIPTELLERVEQAIADAGDADA